MRFLKLGENDSPKHSGDGLNGEKDAVPVTGILIFLGGCVEHGGVVDGYVLGGGRCGEGRGLVEDILAVGLLLGDVGQGELCAGLHEGKLGHGVGVLKDGHFGKVVDFHGLAGGGKNAFALGFELNFGDAEVIYDLVAFHDRVAVDGYGGGFVDLTVNLNLAEGKTAVHDDGTLAVEHVFVVISLAVDCEAGHNVG